MHNLAQFCTVLHNFAQSADTVSRARHQVL